MVTDIAYHRAVQHAAAQFAQLLREAVLGGLATRRVVAIPELDLEPDRGIGRELQPFPPVLDGFRGQTVLRSPRPHIREMAEHIAPRRATASEFFAALESLPQAHQLPERGPVRDCEIEPAGDPLVIPGIAVL